MKMDARLKSENFAHLELIEVSDKCELNTQGVSRLLILRTKV